MQKFLKLYSVILLTFAVSACGGGGSGVSVLPTQDAFDKDMNFNPQMDILWVVDPSRSMRDEIEKVQENIGEFVEEFITSEYQYRMGVVSTAAWSDDDYIANNSLSYLYDDSEDDAFKPLFARLHRGECIDPNYENNEAILDYLTASEVSTFMRKFNTIFDVYGLRANTFQCGLNHLTNFSPVTGNIFSNSAFTQTQRETLGTTYMLEEKPLQSMQAFLRRDNALDDADPNKFLRKDAYLAIIIITDEPDSSAGTAEDYIDFLQSIKNPEPGDESLNRFGIYSIVKTDIAGHKSAEASRLSAGLSLPLTSCEVGAGCFDIDAESYKENLNSIKSSILVEATAYPLGRPPVVSTISVTIKKGDGSPDVVLNYDANDPKWFYDPNTQSISFHEDYLPTPKDEISVDYTPTTLGAGGAPPQPFLDLDGNSIAEETPEGTHVGTVILSNGTALVGDKHFEIIGANTGGFVIDPTTGEVSNGVVLDADTRARHELQVQLTITNQEDELSPPVVVQVLERTFLIRVNDVPDKQPEAQAITIDVSVTTADPITGMINVSRNVAFEALGMDTSEEHIFSIINGSLAPAGLGTPTIDASTGLLTFEVNQSLITNPTGQTVTFRYGIQGTDGPPETLALSEALVTININRENSPPEIIQHLGCAGGTACGTPHIDIGESTVDPAEVVFNASDVTASCITNGSAAELVSANPAQGLVTCTGTSGAYVGAPYVELTFPIDKPFFEVREFRVQGRHSLGNAILQIRAEDDRVLDREVIGVADGGGLISRAVQRPVIGRKIRILRPQGGVNPDGEQYLNLGKITAYGVKAEIQNIDLDDYFSDPDFGVGDTLTYIITGETEEHPAPSWASLVNGHILRLMPPANTQNRKIRIEVRDSLGIELVGGAYELTVSRLGSGDFTNAPPISLLSLDDAKRGGVTLNRYGGGPANSSDHQLDNMIRHGEGDNFLTNPYAGQAIRDALTAGGITDLRQSIYRNINDIPIAVRQSLEEDGHDDQLSHFGDNYDSHPENGWSIMPTHTSEKYPLGASSYCTGSPAPDGRIMPCINSIRSYGETYTGYFVPAKSGVYRFRSPTQVDDLTRLLLAPTEYVEDLQPIFTTHHTGVEGLAESLYNVTGDAFAPNVQFSPNSHPAGGHDTTRFFDNDSGADSYDKGYVRLVQGNVYAFEIRFQEGGGDVRFEFQYDRKDANCDVDNTQGITPPWTGACWDGWRAIDASVMVPTDGVDKYEPTVIKEAEFPFDMSKLFYDPEDDDLQYTARLVNPDGTEFSNDITLIGLNIGSSIGNRHLLSGTLNSTFTSIPEEERPRIVIKATEMDTDDNAEVESLPIKLVEQ